MGKAAIDPFDDFKRNRDRVTKKQPAPEKPKPEPEPHEPAPVPTGASEEPPEEGDRPRVPAQIAAACRGAYGDLGAVQANARPVAIPEWPGGSYARIVPRPPERGEIIATLGLSVAIPIDEAPFELAYGNPQPGQAWAIKIIDHYVRRAARGELRQRDEIFQGHPLPPTGVADRAILIPWSPAASPPSGRGPAPLLRICLLRREELAWAALFGKQRLLDLLKAHGLLAQGPDRRGLLELLPARPKLLDAQKAAAAEALPAAGEKVLAAVPPALDRVVPPKGPGTGWEESALTVFGDGGVDFEAFTKAGTKKSVRWRWTDEADPALEGQKLGAEIVAAARALADAAGLRSAEPAATKPGHFVRVAYALNRGGGKPRGELRTF